MVFSVWCSSAHTLLAFHVFNGSPRRLPHAQARWVPMIFGVWFSLAHTLLASHVFQWFFETAASRFGAMGADDVQRLVQFGSHTFLASRAFSACSIRLPHAVARWPPMIYQGDVAWLAR